MFTFFTEADPVFGRISWTTGVIWLAALGLSAYFLTRWQTSNLARRRFWRRWALGTLVIGGLTVVALVLNFFEVPIFNIRAWIYLFSLATLAYWAYAAYFYFTKLPGDVAAAARASRPVRANQRGTQPVRAKVYNDTKAQGARAKVYNNKQTNATPEQQPAREPRPVATTSRRESRRDRKRRSR
jgi:hypothetical protein